MTLLQSSASAAAQTTTYDGFYFRTNLNDKGTVPSPGPYDLCPDIIQSPTPIPNAQSALSTMQSWSTMYSTDPVPGQTNYYYLRGMNGAAAAVANELSLYWVSSQLILFPSLWKNSMLATESGAETVSVTADPGHIGVGLDAFVWASTPIPDDGQYYCLISQSNDQSNSNPVPTVTTWQEMGSLLAQNLGFGLRNTSYVDPSQATWYRRLSLTIPASLETGGQLAITVVPTGLVGNTVGFVGDLFSQSRQPIVLNPTKVVQDGQVMGVQLTVEPGFVCGIAVEYWNTAGRPPAAGSTLVLQASYIVPGGELVTAAARALTPRPSDRRLAEALNVGPTATIPLGSATFIVGDPTPA